MADEKKMPPYLQALRGKWPLLLLAVAGIFLLLFGGGAEHATAGDNDKVTAVDTEEYRAALEEELTVLCSRVAGAGRVVLALTLEGGGEAVYATDSAENGRVDYVLSGGEGLLLYRKSPAVLGVGVVCEGGRDPTVCRELTALLSATLGIGKKSNLYLLHVIVILPPGGAYI